MYLPIPVRFFFHEYWTMFKIPQETPSTSDKLNPSQPSRSFLSSNVRLPGPPPWATILCPCYNPSAVNGYLDYKIARPWNPVNAGSNYKKGVEESALPPRSPNISFYPPPPSLQMHYCKNKLKNLGFGLYVKQIKSNKT